MLIQELNLYHTFISKIYKKISNNTEKYSDKLPSKTLDIINDIKNIDLTFEELISSDNDIIDIYEISGLNASRDYKVLTLNINKLLHLVKCHNKNYNFISRKLKNKSTSMTIDQQTFQENKYFMYRMHGSILGISSYSKKVVQDIEKFLVIFINGKNFHLKNIKFEFSRIDGGFETIKRTVP